MSVYVGIDVHRKRSQVAVVTGEGTVQLTKNVVNCSEPFLRLIGDLPPGTPVTFEATFGTPRVGPLLPRSADVTAGPPAAISPVSSATPPARQDQFSCLPGGASLSLRGGLTIGRHRLARR
jgi:hypothetical protein